MAQESKPSRPRTTSTGQEPTEPAAAPITSNTPLPPLNPLPLGGASDPGGPAAPDAGLMPPDAQATPPPYYNPPPFGSPPPPKSSWFGGGSGQGTIPTWAIGVIFIVVFTSLILLTVLAVSAANVEKDTAPIWWAMAILVVTNVLFPLIVVNLSRGLGPLSIPFVNSQRRP